VEFLRSRHTRTSALIAGLTLRSLQQW
jgi:hypothetical protein